VQKKRALGLLEEVDLTRFANSDPRRLSVGQCQRVGLARALAGDPDIILADEPTASLDDVGGRQVLELMKRLVRERHKTAVVVTHDPRILPFADRVCHLRNGRLHGESSNDAHPMADASIGEGLLP
jgi:putative ABC transport system ATP-binding protein